MISFRTLFPVLGVVVALAGCSAENSANNGVDSANAAQQKSTLSTERAGDAHRPGGPAFAGRPHGGPDFLVFAALHENLNLSTEQRSTIEGLVAKGHPAPPAPDKARAAALASAIRANKIDATTFQAPAVDREAMMKEHLAKSANSLATLHKTLTKEQRAALVDAIVAKQAQHAQHAKDGKDPGPDGHRGPPPGAHGPEHSPMGFMLRGIDLTPEQQAEIKSKLDAQRPAPPPEAERAAMKTKHEAMKKDMDARLQTFKADAFDANAFVAPPADAPKGPPPGMGPESMAKELSVVVSVLTPAQREELAKRIEQGPPAHPVREAR